MDENVRHSYLKAMGIQLWYPRRELPNAKPGPLRTLTNPVGEVEDRNPLQKADVTAATAKADIARVLSGAASNGDELCPSAPIERATPFKLCLFTNPSCCVIFEVPLSVTELGSKHLRLVGDISRALGSANQECTITFQQWPMIQNDHGAKSDADAQFVLQRRLKRLIGDTATKLLIMGKVSARYLPVEDQTLRLREDLSADFSNTVAATTQGIDDLLQDPIQKRDVWAKIESLKELGR